MQHGHGIDDEERGLQQRVERERHVPAGRSGRHREPHREQERERRPRETWRGWGRGVPSRAGRGGASFSVGGGVCWGRGLAYAAARWLRMEEAWLYGAG